MVRQSLRRSTGGASGGRTVHQAVSWAVQASVKAGRCSDMVRVMLGAGSGRCCVACDAFSRSAGRPGVRPPVTHLPQRGGAPRRSVERWARARARRPPCSGASSSPAPPMPGLVAASVWSRAASPPGRFARPLRSPPPRFCMQRREWRRNRPNRRKLGQCRLTSPQFGESWDKFGEALASLPRSWSTSLEFGPHIWSIPMSRMLPNSSQTCSDSGQSRPHSGQTWPRFGQLRLTPAHVAQNRPRLGDGDRCSAQSWRSRPAFPACV